MIFRGLKLKPNNKHSHKNLLREKVKNTFTLYLFHNNNNTTVSFCNKQSSSNFSTVTSSSHTNNTVNVEKKMKFNDFCSYCGTKFAGNDLHCGNCGNSTYVNPLPVVVGIIQLINPQNKQKKVVTIKRGIEPCLGGYAFPGGFLEERESWQQGLSREIEEEIGFKVPSESWKLETVRSIVRQIGRDNLLLFGSTEIVESDEEFIKKCKLTPEVLEIKLVDGPSQLCFHAHNEEINRYFEVNVNTLKKE